ncbi:MAG: hypothetical protein ACI9ON_000461 [Limisphaerales bacterium]|jgi:hypothetical protein
MRKTKLWITCLSSMWAFLLPATGWTATILNQDGAVELTSTLPAPNSLWVTKQDLPRISGFELKPEGACLDEICVPIRQNEDSNIFVTRKDQAWVNATELASRIQQPVVADPESDVWSFGAIPAQRQSFVRDGQAPDFTLPDWKGNQVSLSDFKGKNIMLLSWASW